MMNYELNKAPVVAFSQSFTTAREKKPWEESVAEVGFCCDKPNHVVLRPLEVFCD